MWLCDLIIGGNIKFFFYDLLESRATFSLEEVGEFNLENRYYIKFELCTELSDAGSNSPLSWYEYKTIQNIRGYVLVEIKLGPFPKSEKLARENDFENMRSAYGLVRQFTAAYDKNNDDFNVLPPEGFIYNRNDKSIFLVWGTPMPIIARTEIPKL